MYLFDCDIFACTCIASENQVLELAVQVNRLSFVFIFHVIYHFVFAENS